MARVGVRTLAWLVSALLASGTYAFAQLRGGLGGFGRGFGSVRMAPEKMPDRKFAICRIMFDSVHSFRAAGAGWRTDYPRGDQNLMIRFSELTKTPVSFGGGRQPNHWVVRLTDKQLFDCPYVVASDVGRMELRDDEVELLRTYLLKGGFLWMDDIWGPEAQRYWMAEMARVLPPSEYPVQEVPLTDPIFSTQFQIMEMPQIPNLPFWRGSGGTSTSEQGAESLDHPLRAIRDEKGRIIVVITHNNDIADSWEREADDPAYFYRFSPNGYALGVNVLLYALTH